MGLYFFLTMSCRYTIYSDPFYLEMASGNDDDLCILEFPSGEKKQVFVTRKLDNRITATTPKLTIHKLAVVAMLLPPRTAKKKEQKILYNITSFTKNSQSFT